MSNRHQVWMDRCLVLAQQARMRGDAPVGCVIVQEGQVIAEACESVVTETDPTAHAELLAIRKACGALRSSRLTTYTLYTNVEPCWMCSYAIRETGISQVVIIDSVADIGGVTSRYPLLTYENISGWGKPPQIVWLALPGNNGSTDQPLL